MIMMGVIAEEIVIIHIVGMGFAITMKAILVVLMIALLITVRQEM